MEDVEMAVADGIMIFVSSNFNCFPWFPVYYDYYFFFSISIECTSFLVLKLSLSSIQGLLKMQIIRLLQNST